MSAWIEGLVVLLLCLCLIVGAVGILHRLAIRKEKRPRENYKLPPWKDVTRPKR